MCRRAKALRVRRHARHRSLHSPRCCPTMALDSRRGRHSPRVDSMPWAYRLLCRRKLQENQTDRAVIPPPPEHCLLHIPPLRWPIGSVHSTRMRCPSRHHLLHHCCPGLGSFGSTWARYHHPRNRLGIGTKSLGCLLWLFLGSYYWPSSGEVGALFHHHYQCHWSRILQQADPLLAALNHHPTGPTPEHGGGPRRRANRRRCQSRRLSIEAVGWACHRHRHCHCQCR
mmetsp:Transcript_5011/g.14237  ORF Transcript_5011/g.14237 Transcript_5011/m.14237 type:complete len:227 (-) Transcript_5011:6-686(-)